MFALHRSLHRDISEGEPLPDVWNSFVGAGIRFHRGEYSLIAGPPGGLKSVLAMQYAIDSKVPTMYVSADMTEYLFQKRSLSLLTGMTLDTIGFLMKDPAERAKFASVLATQAPNLFLAPEAGPTPERLGLLGKAYEEVAGVPAQLIVVDNLVNVWAGGDSEWAGLKNTSQYLHYWALETGSAVLGLAHVKLSGAKSLEYPASQADVKGQISDLPATILTTAKPVAGLRVAAVKNRQGPSDPTGASFVELDFDGARGRLSDPRPKTWGPNGSWYERED